MLLPFTRFYFLSLLSYPFFNPCYFDEATQPEVTMMESHTQRDVAATIASFRLKLLADEDMSLSKQAKKGVRGLTCKRDMERDK
jgi:hypothetical protein